MPNPPMQGGLDFPEFSLPDLVLQHPCGGVAAPRASQPQECQGCRRYCRRRMTSPCALSSTEPLGSGRSSSFSGTGGCTILPTAPTPASVLQHQNPCAGAAAPGVSFSTGAPALLQAEDEVRLLIGQHQATWLELQLPFLGGGGGAAPPPAGSLHSYVWEGASLVPPPASCHFPPPSRRPHALLGETVGIRVGANPPPPLLS